MKLIPSLIVLSSLFVAGVASAEPTGATPRRADTPSGYTYEFTDDPLAAGGLNAMDARIRVRPNAIRATLIRPRTSFVQEMLRSVEKI